MKEMYSSSKSIENAQIIITEVIGENRGALVQIVNRIEDKANTSEEYEHCASYFSTWDISRIRECYEKLKNEPSLKEASVEIGTRRVSIELNNDSTTTIWGEEMQLEETSDFTFETFLLPMLMDMLHEFHH